MEFIMPKVTEKYIDNRRQQIIDAAYRCFARKGFHQTTMREIYAEAGLSPGAIYHYFESKDDIIEASFIFDHQRSLPVLERAIDDPDPMVAIDQLIDFFYAGLESAAALGANRVNIQGWGEALINPRLLSPLRASLFDFRDRLSRLVRRGQDAEKIDTDIDPEAAGEIVLSTYLGLYLQKAIIPDLDVERYKAVVMALLHGSFTKDDV
jgi:TetR/AcrR family transcriptional regulator, transcriptional repressor of aconitase